MILRVLLSGTTAFGALGTAYFLARLAFLPPIVASLAAAVAAAASGYAAWRLAPQAPAADAEKPAFPWNWAVVLVACVQIAFALAGFFTSISTNPHGEWDAWAIWNVRARMLAAPGAEWRNAVSPGMSESHPDYPLLYPGVTAALAPVGAAAAPAVSALALAGVAAWMFAAGYSRHRTLGWIAVVLTLSCATLLFQAAALYADLPLMLFLSAAAVCVGFSGQDSRWGLFAGLFAGFAAFTKNEGLPFVAIAAAATLWLSRPAALEFAKGLAPLAAVVLAFKFAIAPAVDPFVTAPMAGNLTRFSEGWRWAQIAKAFGAEFASLSAGWVTNPLLLGAIAAFTLRWERTRAGLAAAGMALATLAVYFAIFLVTPSDLTWHLSTALNRLVLHAVPLGVLALAFSLKAPEASLSTPQSIPETARTKTPSSAASQSSGPRRGKAQA